MDNSAAHTGFEGKYTNVEIKMLPVNKASKLQPCDQGVIHFLKAKYRGKWARLLMKKVSKDVTLFEDLLMVCAAWDQNVTA